MEQKLRRAILAPWHPDAPMQLKGLSPACFVAGTETAQRFLAGAYDSVEAVLGNLQLIRSMREAETGDIRGRLTANEEDLLRAAIVFTGAGLDATLKQLIRDTLGALLKSSDLSHEKFEEFAAKRLRTGEIAEPKMIARYLTSETPRELLIEDYIYDLTGSSLQSAEEVDRAAGALGIDDGGLRKRIKELRPLFVARNQIAHELDLRRPERRGDRAKEDSVDRPHKGPLPRGA
jgi:hypothetical protein